MTYTDMMLDLETLGTDPGCPILSIGAVLFNSHTGEMGPTFHQHLDIQDQLDKGAVPSASTLLWWLGQGAEARAALIAGQSGVWCMRTVLHSLGNWYSTNAYGEAGPLCWALPASFDFTLLRAAVPREGPMLPWNRRRERCLRTIADEYPKAVRPKPELAHDALSDALAQAQWLVNIRAEQRRERGAA